MINEIEIKNGNYKEHVLEEEDETVESIISYKKRKLLSQIRSEIVCNPGIIDAASQGNLENGINLKNRLCGNVGNTHFYFCGKESFYIHKITYSGEDAINDSLHFFSNDDIEQCRKHFEKLKRSDPLIVRKNK